MRRIYGVSAEDQAILSEERRQTRPHVVPGSEDLAEAKPSYIEDLNVDDGTGDESMAFVLGIHNPFDTRVSRILNVS